MTLTRALVFLIASALIALAVVAFSYAPETPQATPKRCLHECQRGCEPPEVCGALGGKIEP
jgi:hypothetical protein